MQNPFIIVNFYIMCYFRDSIFLYLFLYIHYYLIVIYFFKIKKWLFYLFHKFCLFLGMLTHHKYHVSHSRSRDKSNIKTDRYKIWFYTKATIIICSAVCILFTNAEICLVYTWEIPEAYFFVNMRMYFTSMQQNCDDMSLIKFDMYT